MSVSVTFRRFGVGVLVMAAAAVFGWSSVASAETMSFAKPGCETWKVPPGVSSINVAAVGEPGREAVGSLESGKGGAGDEVTAKLKVSAGQTLDVCVDQGGGKGGELKIFNEPPQPAGGDGGGASGLSFGSDFSKPLVVAGGGGGAGEGASGTDTSNTPHSYRGGDGGAATLKGKPGGGPGGGAGGGVEGGAASTSAGPGVGGQGGPATFTLSKVGFFGAAGGGGGGGYVGGGGGVSGSFEGQGGFGAGGGGGGGTDFCTGAGVSLCVINPGAGTAAGSVTLTYTIKPATTLTTALSGEEGQKGEAITVKEGEGVTDQATLSGTNAAKATGTVTYKIYSDNQCTNLVKEAGTVKVTNGSVPPSESERLAGGVNYHWQAEYSGDGENEGSKSECTEVELVLATCGKTTVGKASDQLLADTKRVNACKLPFNADITELVFYLAPTSHSGTQLIKGVVYEDVKGQPGKLLGETGKFTFSSGEKAGWHHFLFATPLNVPKGNCWIGVITGKSSQVAGERFDSVPKAEDYNANSYLSGASKFFGSFKTTNEQMSLYAGFTRETG
jgi:hypothetical protein